MPTGVSQDIRISLANATFSEVRELLESQGRLSCASAAGGGAVPSLCQQLKLLCEQKVLMGSSWMVSGVPWQNQEMPFMSRHSPGISCN